MRLMLGCFLLTIEQFLGRRLIAFFAIKSLPESVLRPTAVECSQPFLGEN